MNLVMKYVAGTCTLALLSITILLFYRVKTHQQRAFHQAQQIYTVLDHYRITYDIDARGMDPSHSKAPQPISGVSECIEHIADLIIDEQPLKLLMVSFPFKSINHEKKTLGDLPDMGDRKALEYLQTMLNKIKEVYSPGAQLTIFCDGAAFAEYFQISPQALLAYEEALQKIASDLPDIKLYTAVDLMRDEKLGQFNQIPALFDAYVKDSASKISAKAIELESQRSAMDFDCEAGRQLLQHQPLNDVVSKILVREMGLRNYLSQHFHADQFLRLTVHFSKNVSKKFGIKLSPTSEITPYHGVMIEEDDGSWSLRFKKDVDQNKYILVSKKINTVDCYYYQSKKSKEIV